MAKTDTAAARAPRGTKIVAQAFLSAADTIPEARRDVVVKAALNLIREELKTLKTKMKTAGVVRKSEPMKAPVTRTVGRPKLSKSVPVIADAPKKGAKKTPKKVTTAKQETHQAAG